ncbi:MAG TPA: P-II family nitrogen regulator [Candidatus Omnitrophota bacterium]|nr:P-II family nitrogen regulator [Candidatus Omnitrophota bacterium]
MKEIKAYIQPFMLQKVTDALHKIHIRGMSVSEIKGFGREKDAAFPQHSKNDVTEFSPKTKIEIICNDDEVDLIIETIPKNAHTGHKGDGKIIVTEVLEAISILSGEKGSKAI